MNAPSAFLAVRWLVWDTFRQAQASAVFWLMLTVSLVCIAFCLSVSTDLPPRPVGDRERPAEVRGTVRYLFGAVEFESTRYREDEVRWLQLMLAGGVADTAGVLFALIWTAAFLPTFLEPSSATVLLAKPVPRWSLLAGKYVGVVCFVGFQAVVFVAGTWLALGARTGVWDGRYLLSVPLLLLHFGVFFSFSCLLAVTTRSAVVCVVGSLLFWMMCWGMNFGRHAVLAYLADHAAVGRGFGGLLEVGYWVLPKPADFGHLLTLSLGSDSLFPVHREFREAARQGALHLEASVLSSVAFAAVMLGLSGYELEHADY